MSLILLHHDSLSTAAHEGRVVKAAWVPAVHEARDTLAALAGLVADERARGYADGYGDGMAQAQLEADAQLTAQAADADSACRAVRAQAAALAIQIVQQLAPSLGPAQLVPALAERIARDLVPDSRLEIHVHPDALVETRARLSALDAPIEVLADPAAELFACRIETAQGRIDGSLDVQLDALARAFATSARTAAEAHDEYGR